MKATKKPLTKIKRSGLTESANSSDPHDVDREAGIIRHVKVLGATSPNCHGLDVQGTDYSRPAMEAALSHYDDRQVYVDHPPRSNPKIERSTRDLAGTLRSPVLEADGIYADFHFLPNTEDGKRIADIAEKMPNKFGLSHNADGSGAIKGGRYVIESIDAVRSVDIVTRPATTKGLYESQEPGMSKTFLEALTEIGVTERAAKTLLEMDGFDGGDAPVDTAAPAAAPEDEDAATHLARAVTAFMSDDTIDAAAKKKKINAILAILDNAEAPAETPAEDAGEGAEGDEPPPEKKKEAAMESLEAEVKKLRDKDAVRTLCESEKFTPSPIQLKSLCLLESEADRKAFITEIKATSKPVAPSRPQGPRSSSSASLIESRNTTPAPVKNGKDLAAAIAR